MKFEIAYAQQELPATLKRNIFLAGPTPRDKDTKSWRPDAIEYFKKVDFDGWLFIPEMEHGFETDFGYASQIEWEEDALHEANVIVFWVPRELKKMPAFTTNTEWGYWMAKDPSKMVLGYPINTPKMNYMTYYANKLNIPLFHTLDNTLSMAIKMLNER